MSETSKSFYGSICLTDLINQAAAKHSAFNKAESNGKTYVNITVWDNGAVDKYGNQLGIQLATKKDSPEHEKKIYIGNAKPNENKSGSTAITDEDIAALKRKTDDLPF